MAPPARAHHTAVPVLTKCISSCLEPWLSQMPMPPSIALTRSWKDVDYTLRNASLQGQLCKLQGCEWGHLRRQDRRLGQEGLGSGILPSSPSSLGSKQGGAAVVGRPMGEAMFMPHHRGYHQLRQLLTQLQLGAGNKGLFTSGTFLAPFSWQGSSSSARPGSFPAYSFLSPIYTKPSGSTESQGLPSGASYSEGCRAHHSLFPKKNWFPPLWCCLSCLPPGFWQHFSPERA